MQECDRCVDVKERERGKVMVVKAASIDISVGRYKSVYRTATTFAIAYSAIMAGGWKRLYKSTITLA